MMIYEITAAVRAAMIEKFERFMRDRHIPDLMATGHFKSAEMARISAGNYRIRYLATDRGVLEEYFHNHGERLRRDFTENFPDGVEISRQILEVLEVWPKEPA
ncbi:MAG: DUF4286 family protein [Pyrinomonadaceae bacterium]